MTEKPYITTGQLARKLGIANSTVLNMIQNGQIQAIRIGNWWRIPQSEVTRILKEGVSLHKDPK